MAISDRGRVSSVAQQIREASNPDVQADIDALLTQPKARPAWLKEAQPAMERRLSNRPASRAHLGPLAVNEGMAPSEEIGVRETIVFAIGTPVYVVRDGRVDLDSARAEAKAWRTLLAKHDASMTSALLSVGRIDVDNFVDDSPYVGTAWVIDDGLIVTNRHVASLFAEASGAHFKFRLGFDARTPIGVRVDFLEEFGNTAAAEVAVERIVWVAPEAGPDVAFLKLAESSTLVGRKPLIRSTEALRPKSPVAVVGYPARDTRFSDRALAEKVFGGVFDKKRVAVGQILGVGGDQVTHGCSTLGGNSGSPVIDIATGEVVALHYRGVEFVENDAVPVSVLGRCLERARALLGSGGSALSDNEGQNAGTTTGTVQIGTGAGSVTVTIPLRITVELGGPIALPIAAGATPAVTTTAASVAGGDVDKPRLAQAVAKAKTLLANRADVVAIKPGYRFENGMITNERAVVVSVRRKIDKSSLESRGVLALPQDIDGVRVDVTVASTADLSGEGAGPSEEARTPSWRTSYKARPDLPLTRRSAEMGFVIHSGPDSGWPQLSKFLKATRTSLAIAMYEFGAPHVVKGVLASVKGANETIDLVLQLGGDVGRGTKKDDFTDVETVDHIREAKASKFTFAPASVGKAGIFDSAYHIKVAVRDNRALWLSSGSWQTSNQPDVDPFTADTKPAALRQFNREWHVILDDPDIAGLFAKHIERDLKEAQAAEEAPALEEPLVFVPTGMMGDLETAAKPRYFEPLEGRRTLDVHPILTPDNYIATVLPFIQSAKRSVLFQNQSFNTKTVGGDYGKLLDALLAKQQQDLDVRIIFRSFGPDDRDTISFAKDYGFDTDRVRIQKNCHTKGIVIDGAAVLIGSHNWTTAGTGFNRDASLIFYDPEIAKFYGALFEYDWERVGPAKIDESLPPPILVPPGDETPPPPGYVAVPQSLLLGR
ncbi:phospholipase D-like domain-containing protein [Phenylobacterium sp. LjRoot225]|uniref:phospholipase D-like domain-containing protein n=1 Tax=Phenylobacterium sp. LjRoot225 TaxID=3342285 RepID=UPI003ECCB627